MNLFRKMGRKEGSWEGRKMEGRNMGMKEGSWEGRKEAGKEGRKLETKEVRSYEGRKEDGNKGIFERSKVGRNKERWEPPKN